MAKQSLIDRIFDILVVIMSVGNMVLIVTIPSEYIIPSALTGWLLFILARFHIMSIR